MQEVPYQKPPCIGICSTTFGDSVCRGCKRYSHEIVNWNQYDLDEKSLIWKRLENNRISLLRNMVVIQSRLKLERTLKQYKIVFHPQQHPYWWVFDLLKRLAKEPAQKHSAHPPGSTDILASAGLNMTPDYKHWSIQALYNHVNQQLYTLAEAQHQHQSQFIRQ